MIDRENISQTMPIYAGYTVVMLHRLHRLSVRVLDELKATHFVDTDHQQQSDEDAVNQSNPNLPDVIEVRH
jgi:hypothetical protein